MTIPATNYARNVHTKALVFFDGEPPSAIKAEPASWATWFPTDLDLARRIGESSDQYCARNGHRPRRCSKCLPTSAAAVA